MEVSAPVTKVLPPGSFEGAKVITVEQQRICGMN